MGGGGVERSAVAHFLLRLDVCSHRTEKRNFLDCYTAVPRGEDSFSLSNARHLIPARRRISTMSRGSRTKTEAGRSSLLSPQESERLEELLGRRCAVSSDLSTEACRRKLSNCVFVSVGVCVC